MVVSRDDAVIYGNPTAFRDLAAWMSYLASSPPSEHNELHFPWHVQSPFAKAPRLTVVDRDTGRHRRFEVTFMVVENADLEAMTSQKAPHRSRRLRSA